jgi:hypothetical protein
MKRVLPLLLGGVWACGTGASVTGEVNGYGFALHTVYGWVDATELNNRDGKQLFEARPEPRLILRLSGASYDPEADLRFAPISEVFDLAREEQLNGSITIRLSKYQLVNTGQVFNLPSSGNGDTPELSVDYSFGLKPLDADAVYPAEVPRFGSRRTAKLTLAEIGRMPGEGIQATLELGVETESQDPSDARTGRLTVEIDAPLIYERIAECNQSQQITDRDCEPDRPPSE